MALGGTTRQPAMTAGDSEPVMDYVRIAFDFFKHVTTLATGSIVLLMTFGEKMLGRGDSAQAVAQSIFCFAISILGALVCMFVLAFFMPPEKRGGRAVKFLAWGASLSSIGFLGGIALLTIATFRYLR